MNNLAAIIFCAIASSAACMADSRDDFRGMPFAPCKSGPYSAQRRMAMFERRKGTFRVDFADGSAELPFFRCPDVRAMYIRVSETNRVSMFFADSQHRFLSSPELMKGSINDRFFFWGGMTGVLAEYGVVENVMPLTVSPYSWRRHYFLRRTDEAVDDREIVCLDSAFLCIAPAAPRDDVRIICGSDENIQMMAQCRDNPDNSLRRKVVACYSLSVKDIDMSTRINGLFGLPVVDSQEFKAAGWSDLLVCFYCDGKSSMAVRRVDHDNWYYYTLPFMLDARWYEQFKDKKFASALRASGDTLVEDYLCFEVSSKVDGLLRYRYPKSGCVDKTLCEKEYYIKEANEVESAVADFLKCPEKFCVHRTYNRLDLDGKDRDVRRVFEELWECDYGMMLRLDANGKFDVWSKEWK